MSRYVEITKDGNNYTVNPNATPSGGSVTAYGWENSSIGTQYTNFSIAPDSKEELLQKKQIYVSMRYGSIDRLYVSDVQTDWTYEKIDDDSYKLTSGPDERIFTHNTSKDFTLW